MNEAPTEEGNNELSEWKQTAVEDESSREVLDVEITAKRVFVGAGARMLFYPTLLYNVVRNKLQPEFRWWDQIHQYLLLGAVPFPGDVPRLKSLGVRGVVTLNEAYETLVPTALYQKHGINHLVIPTRDYLFAPSLGDIRRAVAFIHEHVQRGEITYVHCKAGRGRSTTVVLCYLVEHQGMSPVDAFQFVRSKRPRVLLAAAQWQAVREYSKQVGSSFDPHLSSLAPAIHQQISLPRPVTLLQTPLLGSSSCHAQLSAATRLSPSSLFTQENNSWNVVSTVLTLTATRNKAIVDTSNDENLDNTTEGEECDSGSSDPVDDSPVMVTSVDLAGYRSIEDAGLIGNDLWHELGFVYRVRLVAARNVVNAAGAAKATMDWARLSCLFLGCQAESNRVLTADSFHSPKVSHTDSLAVPSLLREQLSMARLSLPLCQSGMVNG
ncbi:hypothetical protein R1sor_010262 [Riccia sorocarpa]|uniref:phosphatidylglycerophosphatase n=1 Tax=Riccia sorocarpa TaxID=122646 RepID=A0ABD3HZ22_9MARC